VGHIRIRQLGKAYKRYTHKWGRLAEWVGLGQQHQPCWILRDIDLDVAPGESLGIIGVNGAGKSTLLKLIAGTVQPTTGSVERGGRLAALLELGIGFHPEFTGRDNVWSSAALAGLDAATIAAHMAGIEAFAEIGDYIDQPVRTYSSGMQVRLAFAVATAVRPDILIVDEALAVGDVFFQQKCFERIRGFREQGTTLLFVSHAMSTVYSLCDRAVLLDEGRVLLDAEPRAVIDLYNAMAAQRTGQVAPGSQVQQSAGAGGAVGSYASAQAEIESVTLLWDGAPARSLVGDSEVLVRVQARFHAALDDPHVGFQLRNQRGEAVFMTHTHGLGRRVGPVRPGQRVEVDFRFRAILAPGDYSLTAGIAETSAGPGLVKGALARVQDAWGFSVTRNAFGPEWDGLCNLAPACEVRGAAAEG
jgi:lipopolysaccharide transport system ATP-binding protein